MRVRTRELVQLLGSAGAVVAWLGWFQVAPALGFPTIGPAAMVNRIFLPKSDPGVWLGWVLTVFGLVGVTALYALATARGWIPPGPLSGLLFGLAAWAIGGMVLMVIMGHISPPTPAPPAPPGPPLPTTPDPMHATFLMLHLGALAPVEALAAWLLFGGVVGGTSASIEPRGATTARSHRLRRIVPAGGVLTLGAAVVLAAWMVGSRAFGQALAGVESRVLATGAAKALPEGAVFVSIIELRQSPGATLGPHAHVPGFAYVLRGHETISFGGRPILELGAGEGGFMEALAIHSHVNGRRVPGAVLAAGLLAIGLVLVAVSISGVSTRRAATAALTGLLIAAGTVALWDPWVNDWFFIGVRPIAARGGVMPLPDAARIYESPELDGLSAGPYTETLRLITIPAGGQTTVQNEPGPETFLVLSGQGTIRVNAGSPITLGTFQGALAQQGASVQISNSREGALSLLSFSVVGSGDQ
jgi:quercetin dioxygenase-like cupin family protein